MSDVLDLTKIDWSDDEEWNALDRVDQIAIIKSAVTVPEVAQLLGYETENDKIPSPWNPDERTPSCHLYEDHFYDYGTGNFGDLFDLYKAIQPTRKDGSENTLGSMIWGVRNKAVKAGREPGDVEPQRPRVVQDLSHTLPITIAHEVAGLQTKMFHTRVDNAGTIHVPHLQGDKDPLVYGVKLRQPNGQKTSVPGSTFTYRLYSPTGWMYLNKSARCIITEGESDSWAMWHKIGDSGIDVFALPSGASAWKDHWLEDLQPYGTVLLCFDNDRAGEQALEKVSRKVGYDRAKTLKVPQLYNDAREALAAGWEPRL